MKHLLLFLLLALSLQAKIPTFKEIKSMPTSISKDYYIWRFIKDKKSTKKEALEAYKWIKRKNGKLQKAIRKKAGYIPTATKVKKRARDPKNYIIYPATAAKKSKKSLQQLYKRILKQGKYSDVLKVMSDKKPFDVLQRLKPQTQCYIFNNCKSNYRIKNFNHSFSVENLKKLVKEKQFEKSISLIVTTHKLHYLKKSLLNVETNNRLSFKSNFFLAMNAVEFSKITKAKQFLSVALKRAKGSLEIDKCNFWFYLLSKDKKYLEKLLKSSSLNLYTLRARDILKRAYPKVISPKFSWKLVPDFNLDNPLDWEKIKIEMKKHPKGLHKLAEKYKAYSTTGIYSYIKEKAYRYKKPYYAMPYIEAMLGYKKERMALLYAIGRQESRFVPASVSTSYALGMMQIMPFLVKHLAKERKEKLDLDRMFDPYVAISYANQHLNYLNKKLYHPLFVAYAYNGGIGFTRRTIRSKHLFKRGKYEPYLSMELIDYEESKEYGKKVLTNYVIYMNLLGKRTKITPLLEELQHPTKTDKYRK